MDEKCHVDPVVKAVTAEERGSTRTVLLAVWGMGCPNCSARVRNSLLRLHGVTEALVDHQVGAAQVSFNPALATIPALLQAVAAAGGDGRHEYRALLARG